jgi:hypothetical protein
MFNQANTVYDCSSQAASNPKRAAMFNQANSAALMRMFGIHTAGMGFARSLPL